MKKFLLKTGYTCNNNCLFCHSFENRKFKDLTTDEIKKRILKAKSFQCKEIILSGGEPTIRKDIFELARFIKNENLYLGLITNGRMLSYKKFVKNLIENNLKYCYVSLHGTKKIHDKLTQVRGSFNESINGIKNLMEYPEVNVVVNTVVNKLNINFLKKLIDFYTKELSELRNIKFSMVIPAGFALKNSAIIIPDIREASEKTKKAIDYAESKNIIGYFEGIPLV